MEFSLYLKETYQTASLLQDIRDELTVAVRNAILLHAYDTDIDLSFGKIHINSKGSVSQISFNGTDVTDIEKIIEMIFSTILSKSMAGYHLQF